jgi:hypothetical protein
MDNGGKIIKSVLSYSKRIDVVNDNAVVNTVLCEMAQYLEVSPDRVQDEYNGWCGNPPTNLPAAAKVTDVPEKPKPETTTKTEDKTDKTDTKKDAKIDYTNYTRWGKKSDFSRFDTIDTDDTDDTKTRLLQDKTFRVLDDTATAATITYTVNVYL